MATVAVLGLNFAVGVKQRLGFISAINEIGVGNFMRGIWQSDKLNILLGAEQSAAWKKIMSKSKYLKVRQDNLTRDIKDTVSQASGSYKTIEIAGKVFSPKDLAIWSFEWIAMNDRAVIGPLWLGGYNKYVSENFGKLDPEVLESKAVEYADLVVSRSQASGTIFEMPKILRSEGLMRMFTSFMTGSLKYGNRMQYFYKAMQEGAISKNEFFRKAAFETFGYAYGEAIITAILSGAALSYDDDDEWLNKLAVSAITLPVRTAVSPIPVVGQAIASAIEGRDISATPAAEPYKRGLKVAKTIKGLYEDKKDAYNLIWDTARFGEMFYGFPATNLVKVANQTLENLSGEKTALGETIRGKAQ